WKVDPAPMPLQRWSAIARARSRNLKHSRPPKASPAPAADLNKARRMRARFLAQLIRSQDAAVAPTVAISLFGLIAVGGIAFDYARLAAMDSELQAAADQAALAAATQLDQK